MAINLDTRVDEFSLGELVAWVDQIIAGGGGGAVPGSFTTLTTTGITALGAATTITAAGGTQLTVQNNSAGHALIAIQQTVNPGTSGGEEAALQWSGYDAGGTFQQLGSISALWADATAGTGRSIVRIHANHLGGGSNSDFRLYGDQGIALFGTSDTTGPGAGVCQVTGIVEVITNVLRATTSGGTTLARYGADTSPRADFGVFTTNMSTYASVQDDAAKPSWAITLDSRVAGDAFSLSHMAAGGSITNFLTVSKLAAIVLGDPAGTGGVTIAGTAYGAGVASLRLNGLTSAAGANVGTLTNSPHTGNPAFWAPINIAGTVYCFPCFALT